ncbi:lytic murein transglycosylase [Nocardiopsis ansamitocini]|uniref:lytic murein transglycosylase n=1 Tax=Nocardiopsis ansamitocini TaxID=1670832 RepID=UPI0025566F88|nr:lytic murein transglycosylase [Nocardiopsis ansamitocini]
MTVSPPVDGARPQPPGASATDHSWKPVIAACTALVAVAGVTGTILAGVSTVVESAAPRSLPPGPTESAGSVEAVREDTAPRERSATEESADTRPSPMAAEVAEEASPEWLDRVSAATGIPRRALQAYANAQLRLMNEQPHCQISWPTLAAIGSVESRHGTYAGGEIGPDGVTTVKVIGIPLNGENNTAAIPDTDGGRLDGDTEWDRAVGPMQFIPTTWEIWGADASGGDDPDPHNIDDTALSAARYLCHQDRVLTTSEGWWAGILSYNQSERYGNDVLDVANDYVNALS